MYEEMEGVDLSILQAYDAWVQSSPEETGEDDIYGIGFGTTREGKYLASLLPATSSLITCTVTPEELPPLPDTPPVERRQSYGARRRSSVVRQGPARLTSFVPPTNFGAVLTGSVFRSQFPLPENFSFIRSLKLKTILTLVPEPYPQPYVQFLEDNGIKQIRVHVPANKEIVKIEATTMLQALGVVLDRKNYPLLIHCNKGKHRTGCVVGCFRKVLGDSMPSILHEYHTYAGHKARKLDEEFINGFDERALSWLAREHGFLSEDEPVTDSPGKASLPLPSRLRG